MSWRITGSELLDADELAGQWPGDRRHADVSWVDGTGVVAAPGSEWVLDNLRPLDGKWIGLFPSGGAPTFKVNLSDRASAFWATTSLLYDYEYTGDLPHRTWRDTTPPGAVN